MSASRKVGFLFVGGVHHVFHTMPVACALSRREGVEVTAFAADAAIERTISEVIGASPGANVSVEHLKRPRLIDWFDRPSWSKLPLLWRNRRRLGEQDALVTAECTSIALRRMGVTQPHFICLPHGAGDRAVSFESRFRLFDRVLAAGPKTAGRMAESGVRPERIRQVGYPKAEYLAERARSATALFSNRRPTALYNPHFRARLSSLGQAREIVAAIAAAGTVNLIVAPHIRVFEKASPAEAAAWEALAVPGKVQVDTGSERMIDMSYVAAADLYIGDVSSQVYEFLLLKPRPCLFVDAHGVDWANDPDYAFWQLGEVVAPGAVAGAIPRAFENHHHYLARQQQAVAETFGELAGSSDRAADAILELLGA